MAAVTMKLTVVVTLINLAICWNIRLVSDATRFEVESSDNAFGADNQQERLVPTRILRDYTPGSARR
jgi:hypothetical protein